MTDLFICKLRPKYPALSSP